MFLSWPLATSNPDAESKKPVEDSYLYIRYFPPESHKIFKLTRDCCCCWCTRRVTWGVFLTFFHQQSKSNFRTFLPFYSLNFLHDNLNMLTVLLWLLHFWWLSLQSTALDSISLLACLHIQFHYQQRQIHSNDIAVNFLLRIHRVSGHFDNLNVMLLLKCAPLLSRLVMIMKLRYLFWIWKRKENLLCIKNIRKSLAGEKEKRNWCKLEGKLNAMRFIVF